MLRDIRDIIVTTPKSEMANAAKEAEDAKRNNGGIYFRRLGRNKPNNAGSGSRIYYVEDGYVRGCGIVGSFFNGDLECETTGRYWGRGWFAQWSADTWKWIKPIPMKGFQGWRYTDIKPEVVGGWMDPKPIAADAPASVVASPPSQPCPARPVPSC